MVLSPPNLPIRAAGSRVTGATYEADITDAVNFLTNPPIATLLQTVSTQTLTTATWTTITWDNPASTNMVDTYGGYNPGSSTSRYTAQVAGTYRFMGLVNMSNNTTGLRAARFLKNGASIQGSSTRMNPSPSAGTTMVTEWDIPMLVNDYVELQGYQASGGNLATGVDADTCSSLRVLWIHF